MAAFIPYTVKTTVTLSGRQTTSANFANPLFVSIHNLFTARQVLVTSTADLLDLGFPDGHPAVKFSQGLFAGKQAPSLLRIGRAVPSAYTIQVDTASVTGDILSVNMSLGGVKSTFSYTVLVTDTTSQLKGTGLATVLAADAGITTAVSDANGLITIVLAAPTTATAFGVGQNTIIYTTTVETIPDIVNVIQDETTDFAMITAEMHDIVSQEALALLNESNDTLYLYSSQDIDLTDVVEVGDVGSKLKAKEYEYTTGFYHTNADVDFPEGALIGTFASQDPSYLFTANLQSLKGIAVDTLSAGQLSSLAAKNVSWYVYDHGVGCFHEGWTSNGDFLDRVRFALWVKLRSNESLFNTMKRRADRSSCLGYNDKDVMIAVSNLYTDMINVGIRNGAILTGIGVDSEGGTINYNPIVTPNTRANQTNAAIAQRLWEDFTVELVYNSPIHHLDNKTYIVNNRTAV